METKLVEQHLIDNLGSYDLSFTESAFKASWDAIGNFGLFERLAFIPIWSLEARALCFQLVVECLKELFVCRFCILVNLCWLTFICCRLLELFVECFQGFDRWLSWKIIWCSRKASQSNLNDEFQILLIIQRQNGRHLLAWKLKAYSFDDALNLILLDQLRTYIMFLEQFGSFPCLHEWINIISDYSLFFSSVYDICVLCEQWLPYSWSFLHEYFDHFLIMIFLKFDILQFELLNLLLWLCLFHLIVFWLDWSSYYSFYLLFDSSFLLWYTKLYSYLIESSLEFGCCQVFFCFQLYLFIGEIFFLVHSELLYLFQFSLWSFCEHVFADDPC